MIQEETIKSKEMKKEIQEEHTKNLENSILSSLSSGKDSFLDYKNLYNDSDDESNNQPAKENPSVKETFVNQS